MSFLWAFLLFYSSLFFIYVFRFSLVLSSSSCFSVHVLHILLAPETCSCPSWPGFDALGRRDIERASKFLFASFFLL